MKGTWMLIVTVVLTCLSLTVLPIQTHAQQPLDDHPADLPFEDTDENYPPLDEDPELLPLDDEQPLDSELPFDDDQQQTDYQIPEDQEDPFGGQQMAPAQPGRIITPNALQHCNTASGKIIFILNNGGINPGVAYIKSGAQVVFDNPSYASHDVQIVPNGFFSNNSFRLVSGSKVSVNASSPGTVTRGRISVNPSNNETEHYVVICP